MTTLLHSCDYKLSRNFFNCLLCTWNRNCRYLQTMTSFYGYFWGIEKKKCVQTHKQPWYFTLTWINEPLTMENLICSELNVIAKWLLSKIPTHLFPPSSSLLPFFFTRWYGNYQSLEVSGKNYVLLNGLLSILTCSN